MARRKDFGHSANFRSLKENTISTADAQQAESLVLRNMQTQVVEKIIFPSEVQVGSKENPNLKSNLTVAGNFSLDEASYINFGSLTGEASFGLRSNSGDIQFKNSGGTWSSLASATVAGSDRQIQFNDGDSFAGDGGLLYNKTSTNVTDFKGETIQGIKEVTISNSELSRYNESISGKVLSSGSLKETIEWYYVDDNPTADENIVSGIRYKITNVGDTNWSSLGAVSGSLYEVFTATVNGSTNGTGIVKKVNTILSEPVEFLLSETTKDINHRSLNVSIRIEDNALVSRNGIQSVEVFFIDRLKQYDSVKIPYDMPSENLGDVYYKIIDSDTNKVLIDYEVRSTLGGSENPGGTLMFFDGEKYIFDMYIPKSYKNKRIYFEFFQYDNINKIKKYIKSNDLALRIK